MHELQVTQRILNVVLNHAEKNSVNRVVRINLRIGELSDLENEWIQQYFDYLSKDTVAAGARLNIERVPVVMRCRECQLQFEVNIREMEKIRCPECRNESCTMISGKEYYIKDLEVL